MRYRPDLDAGFWCEWRAPKSAVASLVQMPLYRIDGYALATAYMKDFRDSKRTAKEGGE